MILTLELILDEMADLCPVSNQKTWKNSDIPGIFYYSADITHFHDNSIYVCEAKELDNWNNAAPSVIFFIINGNSAHLSHIKNLCFILQNAASVTQIVNRYMQMMADYSCWDKEMHLDIINSSSLETMLNYASEIIDYPVQVYDPSFHILATTKHHKADISDFQFATALGYTPPDFFARIQQKQLLPRLQKSNRGISAPAVSNPEHTNIYRAHRIDGQLSGYSCIFCGDAAISQGFLDKTELFLSNLDFYFKENRKHLVLSQFMYESFLISLLSSRQSIASKWIIDRAKIVHLPLQGEFVLIQLNFDGQKHLLQYLCRLIQKYLPDHSAFVYEDDIYLLIAQKMSLRSSVDNARHILKHLQEMLSSYSFSCYMSNPFYELTGIYDAYILCNKIKKMQVQFAFVPGVYCYQDWQPVLHFLQYGDSYDIKSLCMPEVCKIKQYDRQYHTRYLDTLYAYFDCGCDLKKTAAALNMHRNSIANRIEKIHLLFHLDLADFKTCYNIYGSLQLMKYADQHNEA